jgi:hypothetical protein
MTTALPPYSGATTCPKCTCQYIASQYIASQPQLSWSLDEVSFVSTVAGLGPECMLRTCHDCGYAWLEQTADATNTAG